LLGKKGYVVVVVVAFMILHLDVILGWISLQFKTTVLHTVYKHFVLVTEIVQSN